MCLTWAILLQVRIIIVIIIIHEFGSCPELLLLNSVSEIKWNIYSNPFIPDTLNSVRLLRGKTKFLIVFLCYYINVLIFRLSTDSHILFDMWERMQSGHSTNAASDDKFTIALKIVANLFPGHQHVFDWLVRHVPSNMISKDQSALWVRVAVTYVVNYGTLQDVLTLTNFVNANVNNSQVCHFCLFYTELWLFLYLLPILPSTYKVLCRKQ